MNYEQLELELNIEYEEQAMLPSELSDAYLKKLLPTVSQKRVFRNYEWDNYPQEYKLLDRALTLFAISPGMNKLQNILYDYYIEGLSNKKLADKYKYSIRQINRLKKKALEEFYRFIPNEYR